MLAGEIESLSDMYPQSEDGCDGENPLGTLMLIGAVVVVVVWSTACNLCPRYDIKLGANVASGDAAVTNLPTSATHDAKPSRN